MNEAAIRAAFAQQAVWCRNLGSPFTALLVEQAAERLDRATAIGRRILDWPGNPDANHDSVPLRFAGALNGLVRAGHTPALAALYPPAPLPDGAALWRAVAETLERQGDALDRWLDSAPQTNEVARSAPLMAGLLVLARETGGRPLALYEVGASAGLNLMLDRYGYRLGDVAAGAAHSPVQFAPDWTGPPPPSAVVRVLRRRGVDLNPVDLSCAADRDRMLAYIWPDQRARLARIEAALAMAAGEPPPLDRGDAADWLEVRLDHAPEAGVVRVLMHSIAFQYFPEATQRRVAAHAEAVGAAATAEAPFAWLRLEMEAGVGPGPGLRLTVWPGGASRLLATGSPHGSRIAWIGA